MKRRMILGTLAALLVTAMVGIAQPAEGNAKPVLPKANQPKAESVMKYIPSDAAGFVVIPNLKGLSTQIQQFGTGSGMGMFLMMAAPTGVDNMLAMSLGLGTDYNPNGGIAVILPNQKAKGCKLEEGADPEELPLVTLLAGSKDSDINKVFIGGVREEAGKTIVTLGVEEPKEYYCTKVGQYYALAQTPEALAGVLQSKAKPVVLTGAHKTCLAENGLYVYAGPELVGLVSKGFTNLQGAMGGEEAPIAAVEAPGKDDTKAFSLGLRMNAKGIVLDAVQEFKAGSAQALTAAKTKPLTTSLVAGLPSMPYGIALGGTLPTGLDNNKIATTAVAEIVKLLAAQEIVLPAKMQGEAKTMLTTALGEMKNVRMVLGSGGSASELAVGFVIDCKNAANLRAMMPQKAKLINEFLQTVIVPKIEADGDAEGAAQLKAFKMVCLPKSIKTSKGKADVMRFVHPAMAKALKEPEVAKMLKTLLGQKEIEVYVSQRSKTELIVSFGGGVKFLETMLAKSAADCGADAEITKVRKILGDTLTGEVYISAANIFNMVSTISAKLGKDFPLEGYQFRCKTPIGIGASVVGNSSTYRLFLPATLGQDVMGIIMTLQMQAEEPGEEEPGAGPGDEF